MVSWHNPSHCSRGGDGVTPGRLTCINKPIIKALTVVPPHTDLLVVSSPPARIMSTIVVAGSVE